MEATDTVLTQQVTASVNYTARQTAPLHNYYLVDPPQGMPASNEVLEAHDVTITSMRGLRQTPQLDVQGFELVPFSTSVGDIYDTAEREAVFNPEVAQFVKRHTGACEVRVFYPFLRGEEAQRRMPGSITAPAGTVHVDETHETGAATFEMVLGDDASRYRGHRFAIVNLWRPIVGPLQDRPLALCDAQSLSAEDLMSCRTVSRADERGLPTADGAIFETAIYSVAHSPRHRWYYVPDMMPDEALLLKNYDSQVEGVARFSPHTAFADPTTPANAPPRASIEIRCLVIW